MSNLIFPRYMLGEKFTQAKTPIFNTGIHRAITGKESRISFQAYPMYKWELAFEILRDDQDGRTNFMPFSSDLTQWTTAKGSSATCYNPLIVANQAFAFDGSFTADQVILNRGTANTVNDYSQVYYAPGASPGFVAAIGQQYVASIYLCTLDGSTVTVALAGSSFTSYTLVTVTPQWQRFTVTGVGNGGAGGISILVGDALATSSYANLGVWGAQVEEGSLAGPLIQTNGVAVVAGDLKTLFGLFNQMMGQQDTFLYFDPDFNSAIQVAFATGNAANTTFPLTATYMATPTWPSPYGLAGIPELVQNVDGPPQIYTARYLGPELLSSGSRTNKLLQSNAFTTTWTANNATATAGATTSPDGTADGWSLNEGTAASTTHDLSQGSIAVTAGQYLAFSCFMKYSSCPNMELIIDDGTTNGVVASFNVQNGTVNGVTSNGSAINVVDATIVPFGTSGWYRCTVAGILQAAQATCRVGIVMAPNATPAWYPNYTGTSRVTYIFGAQIEQGILPTAYIPTTTAAVTNASDYSISIVNVVTPASTLPNGVQWLWTGSFYYRCRFDADSFDFSEFMNQWWELKKISFQQVKL